jgi:hypothetical protein
MINPRKHWDFIFKKARFRSLEDGIFDFKAL